MSTSAASPGAEASTAPIRVLLVEDNDLDAFLLGEMLKQSPAGVQAEVERVGTLTAAMERLNQQGIDLVLLDLSLPDSRELETYRTMEAMHPNVPVIVCSASEDTTLGIESVRLGAQDYLVKGQITPDGLSRSVRYSMERHRMLSALRGLSLVDELTGLYNRRGFLTLAQGHVAQACRMQRRFVLVMADMDSLKPINDRFGHAAGDTALRMAAEVLRQSFRLSDVVARLGGDEFVMLALETSEGGEGAIQARIAQGLAQVNGSGEAPFQIGLSLGAVAFAADGTVRLDEVMERADALLYEQKKRKQSARLALA